MFATWFEKFILRSQNIVSKYNWSTQVLVVLSAGMSLHSAVIKSLLLRLVYNLD